ncbi:MAG: alpha/beta hydrolase [Candidatus Cyclobacteriaceae bacterium M2_1C_046]
MSEHHLDIQYRARYFTHGKLSSATKSIWFVLHGYGQLAKYFIKKFEILDPEEHFVVAPEGTNRFYLQGFEGRVGATWMTREDRETDIYNYINHLNQLHDHIKGDMDLRKIQVNILGFSQGAATASRWITDGYIKADQLILWAGIFPPDLTIVKAKKVLTTKKVILVLGKNDPYIKQERLGEIKSISELLEIKPKELWYDGDHQIVPEVVQQLATSY